MRNRVIVSFLVVMLTGIGILVHPALAVEAKNEGGAPKVLQIGDSVPDFDFGSLDGVNVSYSKDIVGKQQLAVFTFMTTSCNICRAEIESLSAIGRKYKDKVRIYAVAVDMRGAAVVAPYSKQYPFEVTYILDPEFKFGERFGIASTPAVVAMDKTGKVAYIHSGFKPGDLDAVTDDIVKLLK